MALDPLSAAFELGETVIKRIWPDPDKRAEEIRKLEEIKQKGDLAELQARVKLLTGQLEVNAAEAKHKSIFVAGWRPFIGWVGGASLAYQFVVYPVLLWGWTALEASGVIPSGTEAPPVLDTGALFTIVTSMLGIGAMRSIDKKNKVQTDSIP